MLEQLHLIDGHIYTTARTIPKINEEKKPEHPKQDVS